MVTHDNCKQATAPIRFYPFLQLFLLPLIFLTYVPATAADTYSISSDSEVAVRRSPGTEYKTLARLQDGDIVTSLEESGDWVRVRTATDKEGWILKQYLSDAPSADDAFTLPTDKNQKSEQPATPEKSVPLGEQNLKVTPTETKPLPENTHAQQPEVIATPLPTEQILPEPDQKTNETSKSNESIEDITNKLAAVTLENKKLREEKQIQWFLAGSGVFILGWIFGLLACKARRRKPSLL
jgi:SH3 domain protein